jgi:ribosomal protein L35AE/L33A
LSTGNSELAKMKVAELRELAKQLGIEAPSKKTKAQLVRAITKKQKAPPPVEPPKVKAKPAAPIEKVYGIFVNYRQGMFRQNVHSLLVRIPGIADAGSASKYIGRKVVWHSRTGKRIVGKVVSIHGRGGILLSRFRNSLPGQAIGTTVEIV